MRDFLIKLLGGYKLIVGVFDNERGCMVGSHFVNLYPFKGKYCMHVSKKYMLLFDEKGCIEVKENK